MRLIGIKTGNMVPFIKKVLKDNMWYPFGQYQEPTQSNRWEWRKSDWQNNDSAINDVYKATLDDPEDRLEITVNCIVGKNGSGKSALLDIMYRIINNFSVKLFDVSWVNNTLEKNPQRGHSMTYATGVDATLFFESEGVLGCIECSYDNVHFSCYKEGVACFPRQIIKGPMNNEQVREITRHLFYAICTNYSIHSLNDLDYTPNPLWLEYTDSNINGDWVDGLFHKNDGYVVPITMVPFRENGAIDVNKENDLAKQRLATLAVLFASQGKTFLDGYNVKSIKCRFNHEAENKYNKQYEELLKSFQENSKGDELNAAIKKHWEKQLVAKYPVAFCRLLSVVKSTILAYFTYKTLKMCVNYRKYGEILGITGNSSKKHKGIDVSKLCVEWNEASVSSVINEILFREPIIHTNLKIHQVLTYIKNQTYPTNNLSVPPDALYSAEDMKNEKLYGWYEIPVDLICSESNEENHKRVSYRTYDEAFLNMPPAFFDYDLVLTKVKENNIEETVEEKIENRDETLSLLSSGERQLLHSLSYIIYHIKNIESVKEGSYRVKYHNISLIFDEAELYYHPEYQKQFVCKLIKMLSWCHINHNVIHGINILIVTHSPFVLSDIPLKHTLYLNNGVVENKTKETFCGNVHEMLGENFFMKYSIGDVAKKNVEEIIKLYNQMQNGVRRKANCRQYLKNQVRYHYVASIIADDYLRRKVTAMVGELDIKYLGKDKIEDLDKQITALRSQIENLEQKRKQIKSNSND